MTIVHLVCYCCAPTFRVRPIPSDSVLYVPSIGCGSSTQYCSPGVVVACLAHHLASTTKRPRILYCEIVDWYHMMIVLSISGCPQRQQMNVVWPSVFAAHEHPHSWDLTILFLHFCLFPMFSPIHLNSDSFPIAANGREVCACSSRQPDSGSEGCWPQASLRHMVFWRIEG